MVVASFHLVRYPTGPAVQQLVRVPFDRRALRLLPCARFAKLLGTGRGRTMTASVDLRRWAAFIVWDGPDDLRRFRDQHPVSRRWDGALERWDVTLHPLGARGSWDGVNPLDGAGDDEDPNGPVAVLTRATVRWRSVPTFLRAVPAVDRELEASDGLLATVGVGELPVGRQATFSLWRDADAVHDFAYRAGRHREVIRRTRDERWYGEEWFARFRPVESSGTWDGVDPLH